MRSKASWYKPNDSVMFCPPIPRSELANKFKDIVKRQKEEGGPSIKVVEKSGIKIRDMLPGLKENRDCERENCFVHSTGGKGNCNSEGAVYKGQCLTCKNVGKSSIYIGETSRSGFVRGQQHLEAIKDHRMVRNKANAFVKHMKECHEGQNGTLFQMDIIKTFKKPLECQTREGI